MCSLAELHQSISLLLQRGGIENATFESRLMICSALNLPDAYPLRNSSRQVNDGEYARIISMAQRRVKGEPLQYLLGSWQFMGMDFIVDSRVLIPRQDTECLVELAKDRIGTYGYKTLLDVCTGSGCIGLSLARLTGIRTTLSDISPDVLAVAKENAAFLKQECEILEGDLFGAVSGRQFDMIVSNPPYLNWREMETLQREVTREPSLALDGGEDGLLFYRRIAAEYQAYLAPGGTLLMEIGYRQGDAVLSLFSGAVLHRDLAGNDRVVELKRETEHV